jgi:hypothetical protein
MESIAFMDVKKLVEMGWELVNSQRGGSFMKSVQLPENVNVGQLKTEFDNGMLKITMPKLNMKPKKKNPPIIVTVSGSTPWLLLCLTYFYFMNKCYKGFFRSNLI